MHRADGPSIALDRAILACAVAAYLGIFVMLNWSYVSENAYVASVGPPQEICFWSLCFGPVAKSDAPRIFGFAEFISSLALLVIVYTFADARYRFRIAIAPIPLYRLTFGIIGLIGAETLAAEVWLAEGWWLPHTPLFTRSIWQACFGAVFLATFMTWIWYAFIRPPLYGRGNARRYFKELYRLIVRGAETDLAVLADELGLSANSLVQNCPSLPREMDGGGDPLAGVTPVQGYAYDVLQLIANRKFCRSIVLVAPTTAIAIFESAARQQKYNIPLQAFGRNISSEAIGNLDSNLYHEDHAFSGGLLGHVRPFSEAVYGDYLLVEGLGARFGSPLDIDFLEQPKWSADQWTAYSRVTLTTLKAYLTATEGHNHSYVLTRAIGGFKRAFRDFYELDQSNSPDIYKTDSFKRFEVAVEFIKNAVNLLTKGPTPAPRKLRLKGQEVGVDIYDRLVELMFDIVAAAATIKSNSFSTWHLQYSATWSQLFENVGQNDRAWKIVQFKLRRNIYDKVIELSSHRNYQSASVLGLCLSVFGLYSGLQTPRPYRALAKTLLAWARRDYPKVQQRDPRLAAAVLIGSIAYDENKHALVKIYDRGGNIGSGKTFLPLDGLAPSNGRPNLFRRVKVHTDRRQLRRQR